jgi:hypothetical protein
MSDPNAYGRAYDRRHPRERLGRKARRQALTELLAQHADDYRRLVDEKRAELGLPPAKPGRPKKDGSVFNG